MGVDRYSGIPFVARFQWSVGKTMQKFYEKFREKKLIAARCQRCGYVVFPPRNICPNCYSKIQDSMIELSGKGTIESFTEVWFKLDDNGDYVWFEEPQFVAAIKLEGANSTIFAKVEGDVRIGAKVEPIWAKSPEGNPSDLLGFRVVE